ncbi:hypothetical protein GWI33_009426 [Rhynchophorus ferrugineus]|uniref:SANT and BTB domain-containing protein n=1 Tax=Rhynchophorus ferrugineus TaxID=354439 RepID=A0A834M9U4_RHYFE|nr:hypothetical protein GWI33_009426 [Rhynchophorus ferrugineus]
MQEKRLHHQSGTRLGRFKEETWRGFVGGIAGFHLTIPGAQLDLPEEGRFLYDRKKPSSSNDKLIRRRSSDSSSSKLSQLMKTHSEVEIHVCDEVKNMRRTFVCNQKLLVEKMGYFAEVTLGTLGY